MIFNFSIICFSGCCFVTFYTRKAALDAQNALHNIKTMAGVSLGFTCYKMFQQSQATFVQMSEFSKSFLYLVVPEEKMLGLHYHFYYKISKLLSVLCKFCWSNSSGHPFLITLMMYNCMVHQFQEIIQTNTPNLGHMAIKIIRESA